MIEKLHFEKFSSPILSLKIRRLGFKLSCVNNIVSGGVQRITLHCWNCVVLESFCPERWIRPKSYLNQRWVFRPKLVPFPRLLKGTVSRDFFLLVIFSESVSTQPHSIPFQICLKIRGNIRKSRCTTGSDDTSGKFFHIFTSVVDTGGKFANGVNNTGRKFATASNGNSIKLLTT